MAGSGCQRVSAGARKRRVGASCCCTRPKERRGARMGRRVRCVREGDRDGPPAAKAEQGSGKRAARLGGRELGRARAKAHAEKAVRKSRQARATSFGPNRRGQGGSKIPFVLFQNPISNMKQTKFEWSFKYTFQLN